MISPPNHRTTARQSAWQAHCHWLRFYKSVGAFDKTGIFTRGADKFELDHNVQPANHQPGAHAAIALEALAKAIRNPQEWIPVVDHVPDCPQIWHVNLAKRAMDIADKLYLVHFERDRNMIRS